MACKGARHPLKEPAQRRGDDGLPARTGLRLLERPATRGGAPAAAEAQAEKRISRGAQHAAEWGARHVAHVGAPRAASFAPCQAGSNALIFRAVQPQGAERRPCARGCPWPRDSFQMGRIFLSTGKILKEF